METFETVNKALIADTRGVKYLDFRNTLTPLYKVVWVHIGTGYLALIAVLAGAVYSQKMLPHYFWLTIPVSGLLIGYLVAGINLFMHEASHYNFAADKKRNDLLANLFIGLLIGMDIKFYRAMHGAHHRFLGTVKDTEKSYFEAITWRFVIESLTGLRVIKVMAHRNENIKLNEGVGVSSELIKKNNRIFLAAALLNLLLVITFFVVGYWQVALAWVLGLGAVFPFFASFRQILEHRREEADATINYNEVNHGAAHRMFGEGLMGITMGPAGFNRHLLHHWDPQVSYTRLKEVEGYLKNTPLSKELEQSHTTYLQTFMALFNK